MKYLQRGLWCLIWCALPVILRGQIGGRTTYNFLNLSPSARISALGGNLITVIDDDISLAFQNPAALNPSMHQQIAFNHSFHIDGIQHGYAALGWQQEKLATTFHFGIQYVSYGDFEMTNEFFQKTGTFKANEYALTFGAAHSFYDRIRLGANLKVASSQLGPYNSLGIAGDLAASYQDTANQFVLSIVFRNIGAQLTTYADELREPLPFDLQIGISKRLRYLPFRFSVIYHHLHRWDIRYDDPNATDGGLLFLGEEPAEPGNAGIFFDQLFRHFVFNGELLIGPLDNFRLRIGYNHLLRKELSVSSFGSMAGFSFGLGFKINRFRIDYGRYNLHLAGGINQFSISTNLREFRKN